ncbi:hypothetical protein ACWM6M_00430 [Klebsiella quasivariicola]
MRMLGWIRYSEFLTILPIDNAEGMFPAYATLSRATECPRQVTRNRGNSRLAAMNGND